MLLIRNAKLYTMDDLGLLDGGDVLINGDKIAFVGMNLSAPGARVIDARGAYVTPGLVDAHSHIGMWEDGQREETGDGNEETDPVTPQMRALDAINPVDRCFQDAVRAGVITVATGPGSANVLGGQFLAMKTAGSSLAEMVVREPLAMKAAFGENPKSVYGKEGKRPKTRMATAAILREAFIEAKEYLQKCANPDPEKRPPRSLKLEALGMVLRRELPLKMHAHRADDILTAIRLAKEFNLLATIEHCTEGYRIADEVRAAGFGVILGPLISERSKPELKNLTMEAPAILHRAGVKFALATDHGVVPAQYLSVQAGLCVREGLPEEIALRAITIRAAEMIGLQDRVGSLRPNKDADVVLFNGHPLEARTRASLVIANGNIVYEGA
jgi:imidazolonepropionase-like amidohydrolase